MNGLVYGSDFIAKFLTPAWIKPFTTITTRPATAELAQAMLEGEKGTGIITVIGDATAIATAIAGNTNYFYIPTQASTIGIYFSMDTSGSAPAGMECDILIEVVVETGDTVAAVALKLNTTLGLNREIIISDFTSPVIRYSNTQGGACVEPSSGDITVVTTTGSAGTGDWIKLGKLANDLAFDPSPVEQEDSEMGASVIMVTYEMIMNLMNVDERNRENVYDYIDKKRVSVAFFNPTDPKGAMLIIHDIPMFFFDAPFGDTYQLQGKAKKTYTSPRNYVKYYTFNNVLPA